MTTTPEPVDHRKLALSENAAGNIYDANLHALLFIGQQVAELREALAPKPVRVDPAPIRVESPTGAMKQLEEMQRAMWSGYRAPRSAEEKLKDAEARCAVAAERAQAAAESLIEARKNAKAESEALRAQLTEQPAEPAVTDEQEEKAREAVFKVADALEKGVAEARLRRPWFAR